MKCEAKMAAHGGQFCTSVLVPYTVFYVSFSLPRAILLFPEEIFLQKTETSLRISNIFEQSQIELQVIYFHENKLPNYRET